MGSWLIFPINLGPLRRLQDLMPVMNSTMRMTNLELLKVHVQTTF